MRSKIEESSGRVHVFYIDESPEVNTYLLGYKMGNISILYYLLICYSEDNYH